MCGRDRLRRRRGSKGRCRRPVCHPFPATAFGDPRFRHLVARFHRLGARPLAEFLAELCAEQLLRTTIETRLEEYVSRLDRGVLEALDGAELTVLRPRVHRR